MSDGERKHYDHDELTGGIDVGGLTQIAYSGPSNKKGTERTKILALAGLELHAGRLLQWLIRLAKSAATPHLLLAGPSGSGKKTLVHGWLLERFGTKVTRQQTHEHEFHTGGGNKNSTCEIISSSHHIEFTIDKRNDAQVSARTREDEPFERSD